VGNVTFVDGLFEFAADCGEASPAGFARERRVALLDFTDHLFDGREESRW
jgi:hypothetical protein